MCTSCGTAARFRCRNCDTKPLLEALGALPSHRDGAAVFHPGNPAEVETAVAEGGAERAGNVRASLGQIDADAAEAAPLLDDRLEIDAEISEEAAAAPGDHAGLV